MTVAPTPTPGAEHGASHGDAARPLACAAEVWSPQGDDAIRRSSTPGLDAIEQIGGVDRRREAACKAFAAGRPVIDESHGPLAGLALPVTDRGTVTSVATLTFRVEGEPRFGLELWGGKAGRSELALTSSRYEGLDRFARVSRYVAFPKGAGLPGKTWESATPRLIAGLGTSPDFLRSSGAESEGLDAGLGVPVIDGGRLAGVLLMLWAAQRPLVSVAEVWTPGRRGGSLRLTRRQAWQAGVPGLAPADAPLDVPAGDTWIGRAWATRQPEVVHASDGAGLERQGAGQAGLTCGLALPVVHLDDVRALVVWMW